MIRAALPYLRTAESGRVINISSLAAVESYRALGLYCASKAAFAGVSDTLALEVHPLVVQVTAVEAGGMRTDCAGRSLRMAADRLAVYVPMRGEVEAGFRSSDGHQANNPAAVARVILELSDLGRPPNRLVIGHQALERAEAALETRRDLYRSHADLGRHTATGG